MKHSIRFSVTSLLLILMLFLPLFCLADETPCAHARSVPDDFVCELPEGKAADAYYFSDAILIGDSIAASLDLREVIPELKIHYVIGLSPNAALKYNNVEYEGEKITMEAMVARMQPRKLFVMLGSNGLDQMKSGVILDDYHALLDQLLDDLPDTEIYLISVTPIRSPATKEKYPTFTHARIRAFNNGLLEMAQEHGVHYIDCYTPLMMENMNDGLKANFTGDGIHLTEQGAGLVAQAIRTHVVLEEVIYEEVIFE